MAFTSKLSPYPVPSFTHWRWNFPRMQIHDQHRPVFYQTVVSPYTKRVIKLEEKRRAEHAEAQFRAAREALLREQQAKHDDLSRVLSAPDAIRGALTHAIAMNQHALQDLSSATVEALIRHGKVSSLTFAQLLESLAADRVVDMLEVSETRFDRPAAQKRAGDWSGHSRAREAASLLERAATVLPSGVTTQHFNGLMAAYLTCGFTEANRIHTSVYDMMGVRGVHPNATTYLRVMQSLCLTGNPMEAQSIFTFLKEHHTESITIDMYEAMMWGWLMEKDYQRCDELWLEVTTRSNPRPSVRLAEIYIRSILQLAATPVTATTIQFGQTNEVERKRIPGLMQQLKALGIPYTELNTPIWQDVVDALRKYGISKRKFYDFGRSIKQFSFIDHRRVTGVTHDLRELSPVVLTADTVGAIDRNDAMAPFASQDLPSAGPMRHTWETMPLQDVLNHRYVENVNGRSSEKYRDVSTSIHERSPNWMSEVPETRYDKLYAMSNVKLSKMGIRRHLAGDHLNKEEITQRDKRVLSRTMSVARRVRLSVERNRTHRDE